jgi:prepilin-type N-terminal cleavage/methylation domain-containing protein
MRAASPAGFSLIEVLVASGLLATAILSLAQLLAAATVATTRARATSDATILAWQKVEQLRGLAFTVDDAGRPVSDAEADTVSVPEAPAGGTGLSLGGAVDRDVAGYVDCLDGLGNPLGACAADPGAARYRRRWSLAALPDGTGLTIRVRVVEPHRELEQASLFAVRTRRAP